MSNLPKVSVIIPTYNNSPLLEQALSSLFQQTYFYWEAIIVDDGSTDSTRQRVEQLAFEEPRIVYLNHNKVNQGANYCRNLGINQAQGNYIVFLDSDDLLSKHCLKFRVELMENNSELDFGVFSCQLFQEKPGDDNRLWNIDTEEDDINRFLKMDVPWQTSSPIWRKDSLITLGGWDESLLSWQDWELHFRALIIGFKYKKVDLIDCFWRLPHSQKQTIGQSSMTSNHLESHQKLLYKIYILLNVYRRFNSERKYLLAGLYFWLSNRWLDINNIKKGISVWKKCYSLQIINTYEYIEGLTYLKSRNIKLIKKIINIYLNWQWHSKKIRKVFQSNTFRNYKV